MNHLTERLFVFFVLLPVKNVVDDDQESFHHLLLSLQMKLRLLLHLTFDLKHCFYLSAAVCWEK